MLCTLVLHEQRALLGSELLQISRGGKEATGHCCCYWDGIFSCGMHEVVIHQLLLAVSADVEANRCCKKMHKKGLVHMSEKY